MLKPRMPAPLSAPQSERSSPLNVRKVDMVVASARTPGARMIRVATGRILGVVAMLVGCGFPVPSRAANAPDVHSVEVRIGSGASTLAGTLVLPAVPARSPAVVVVSGSGPNNRYGNIR